MRTNSQTETTSPGSVQPAGSGMPSGPQMDAFRRGEEAHARGTEITDSPYWDNDDLDDYWTFGWESAHNRSPNARTERCGRPSASELETDVARPHSLR
jgi:hypothetical protein